MTPTVRKNEYIDIHFKAFLQRISDVFEISQIEMKIYERKCITAQETFLITFQNFNYRFCYFRI